MPKSQCEWLTQRRLTGRTACAVTRHRSGTPSLIKHVRLRVCVAVLLLGVFAPSLYAVGQQPQIHLALSSNVALNDPSQKELAAIFLGHKRQWSDGTRVKIAILQSPDQQRSLLNAVADRSPSQYWAHWRNIVFSGRGIMPKIFHSEEGILKYLAEEEGAIGQITNTDLAVRLGAATLTITGVPRP